MEKEIFNILESLEGKKFSVTKDINLYSGLMKRFSKLI